MSYSASPDDLAAFTIISCWIGIPMIYSGYTLLIGILSFDIWFRQAYYLIHAVLFFMFVIARFLAINWLEADSVNENSNNYIVASESTDNLEIDLNSKEPETAVYTKASPDYSSHESPLVPYFPANDLQDDVDAFAEFDDSWELMEEMEELLDSDDYESILSFEMVDFAELLYERLY